MANFGGIDCNDLLMLFIFRDLEVLIVIFILLPIFYKTKTKTNFKDNSSYLQNDW